MKKTQGEHITIYRMIRISNNGMAHQLPSQSGKKVQLKENSINFLSKGIYHYGQDRVVVHEEGGVKVLNYRNPGQVH